MLSLQWERIGVKHFQVGKIVTINGIKYTNDDNGNYTGLNGCMGVVISCYYRGRDSNVPMVKVLIDGVIKTVNGCYVEKLIK